MQDHCPPRKSEGLLGARRGRAAVRVLSLSFPWRVTVRHIQSHTPLHSRDMASGRFLSKTGFSNDFITNNIKFTIL